MQHLAFGNQVFDRARHVLDRHGRINTVLIEKVDAIGAKALQAALNHFLDVRRPAVKPPCIGQIEAELGCDLDLVTHMLKRTADNGFTGVGAVDLGGVEERHALAMSLANDLNRVVDRGGRPVIGCKAHASKAQF